jgi:hypothetical protein
MTPSQPREAFRNQILRVVGDVRLDENLRSITFSGDQLVELLDLIAEFDRKRNSPAARKRPEPFLELSRFLRQTVKAQNSLNGENLSHGIVA